MKINYISKICLNFINIYQKYVSPFISKCGIHCKFYPSCSEYMKQAIIKYGCIKGVYLGTLRLFRCNPFSKGGYDPLK